MGKAAAVKGPLLLGPSALGFFSFYLEVQVHELVLCSRPRPGQTPRVVNGSALYSPKDQRTQPLGPHTLALFIYFLFFSRISNLTEWFSPACGVMRGRGVAKLWREHLSPSTRPLGLEKPG